jgi:hypothetical protein
MSWPFNPSISIVSDREKGRCLLSSTRFSPGDILWQEDAFVSADCRKDNMADGDLWTNVGAKRCSSEKLKAMMSAFAKLSSVQSLDTARCLLKLVHRLLIGDRYSDNAHELFRQLQPANLDKCLTDIERFRKRFKTGFSKDLDSNAIASLLGILNNNQMELEDVTGSGLFVATAILEHNCNPNCSFTAFSHQVFVVAIRAIGEGERLSIDYGDGFVRPAFHRIRSLLDTYNFRCRCADCTGHDKHRVFCCPSCPNGTVFAISILDDTCGRIIDGVEDIPKIESTTSCSACGLLPGSAFVEAAWRVEKEVAQSLILHTEDYSEELAQRMGVVRLRVAERILHEHHYLLFWCVDSTASLLSGLASMRIVPYVDALEKARHFMGLLDAILPEFHNEKAIQLDKIAQLAVASGDIELARESFRRAFEISRIVNGSDTPTTLKLQVLATDTPSSIGALTAFYDKFENAQEEEWTDDDGDDDSL